MNNLLSPNYPEGRNLFKGKNILLTAAAGSGIGFSSAKRFLEEGANVFISDVHEARLDEAIKNLKSQVIEEVTGKSESFIRKCSDPDLDQQLDHKDAVKIDKACVERGLTPYLLRAHEYIILKELKNTKANPEDLSDLLIKFTILHGQLMDVINSAKNPDGHKGENISSVEKKGIFETFEALEHKILKIKTTTENS